MIHTERWQYSTATVSREIDQGLSVCLVKGVVTPAVAHQMAAGNQRWLARAGVCGQVAICTESLFAVGGDQLLAAAKSVARRHPYLAVPTALVVKPQDLEFFRSYSWLMAQQGIGRAPFTDLEAARRWAAEQAKVFASWPALRHPSFARSPSTAAPSPRSLQALHQTVDRRPPRGSPPPR